jgi:hypothetical protein
MKIVQSLAFVLTIILASKCKENKKEVSSENVLEEYIEIKKGKKMRILFVLTSHDKLGDTEKKNRVLG